MSEITDLGCLSVIVGIFPVGKMGETIIPKNTSPKLRCQRVSGVKYTKRDRVDCTAV